MQMPRRLAGHALEALCRGNVARYWCGGLLLIAAGLKAHQLYMDQSIVVLRESRLLVALIAIEILIAAWLVAGIFSIWSRRVGITVFAGFSVYTLYQALSKGESCNCFGQVVFPPWLMFAVDLSCAALLTTWRPCLRADTPVSKRLPHSFAFRVLFVVVGVLLGAFTLAARPISVSLHFDNGAGIATLDPATWVGLKFPLLNEFIAGDHVNRGSWRIVMYRANCAKCRDVIARYESHYAMGSSLHDTTRVAFLELPPFGGIARADKSSSFPFVYRRASPQLSAVDSPIELDIDDGVVIRILGAH